MFICGRCDVTGESKMAVLALVQWSDVSPRQRVPLQTVKLWHRRLLTNLNDPLNSLTSTSSFSNLAHVSGLNWSLRKHVYIKKSNNYKNKNSNSLSEEGGGGGTYRAARSLFYIHITSPTHWQVQLYRSYTEVQSIDQFLPPSLLINSFIIY